MITNNQLQRTIAATIVHYKDAPEELKSALKVHLDELLKEQRRRVWEDGDKVTLEQAEFDARLQVQEILSDSEPPWVEWGGGECPVPDGHDVEIMLRSARTYRDELPQLWGWIHHGTMDDVTLYRDWTAWEQRR